MAVLLVMLFPGLELVGVVYMLIDLGPVGFKEGGGIRTCFLLMVLWVFRDALSFTLFLAHGSQFRELRCGCYSCCPELLCCTFEKGVDNLNVVRHVSGILAGRSGRKPFELCTDGDLLSLIEAIVRQTGAGTVRISKVQGHADEEMVRTGEVRAIDKVGNDLADRVC